MDLKQLEYVIAIAEEQSISRAAEKLFITQSALNQQLLKLEKNLGIALFERKNHLMVPTYAGSVYLEACRQILGVRKEAYKIINGIINEEAGLLSISYTASRGSQMFARVYPYFHKRYPKVGFKIREVAAAKDMEQLLLRQEVDLTFNIYVADHKNPAFDYIDLRTEPLILAMPITHPQAVLAGTDSHEALPEIDVSLLKDSNFIFNGKSTLTRELVDRIFSNAGFIPNILFESSNNAMIFSLVKQQIACAFLPASYIDPDAPVVYFTVAPHYHWTQSVVKLAGTYLSKPERYFIKLANLQANGQLPELPLTF